MATDNAQDFTDNAMLDLFRAEVETHTQTLNEGLLALEKDPDQLKRIEPLMRAAHSIKGAARIVGVEDGVRVSHALEDCLVAAQNGAITLTSEATDILLRGVDAITRIAAIGEDPQAPAPAALERLLQEIATVRQGKPRSAEKREGAALSEPEASATEQGPPSLTLPARKEPSRNPAFAVVVDGASRTIGIPAHLDAITADRLRLALLEQLDSGARRFRLDMGSVEVVDGPGLALLDLFARTAGAEQSSLELINVGPDLATLFTACGLEKVYRLEKAGC